MTHTDARFKAAVFVVNGRLLDTVRQSWEFEIRTTWRLDVGLNARVAREDAPAVEALVDHAQWHGQ